MALDNDDIKQLIAILQKGLVNDSDNATQPNTKTAKTTKAKRPKTKDKSKQVDRDNLFENMSEFRMHKEDVEIDKKLAKHPPTQRSRNFIPVHVRCRVCGREESVNPVLVESQERYKCNKCSRSSG